MVASWAHVVACNMQPRHVRVLKHLCLAEEALQGGEGGAPGAPVVVTLARRPVRLSLAGDGVGGDHCQFEGGKPVLLWLVQTWLLLPITGERGLYGP